MSPNPPRADPSRRQNLIFINAQEGARRGELFDSKRLPAARSGSILALLDLAIGIE
jgi:hypothetical protein